MSFEIDRKRYSDLFGPTTGDKIRLGDSGGVSGGAYCRRQRRDRHRRCAGV